MTKNTYHSMSSEDSLRYLADNCLPGVSLLTTAAEALQGHNFEYDRSASEELDERVSVFADEIAKTWGETSDGSDGTLEVECKSSDDTFVTYQYEAEDDN